MNLIRLKRQIANLFYRPPHRGNPKQPTGEKPAVPALKRLEELDNSLNEMLSRRGNRKHW